KPSGNQYALAVRLTGQFKTAFPDGKPGEKPDADNKDDKAKIPAKADDSSLKETRQENTVILVGDSDMFYDNFTLHKMQSPFGVIAQQMNGNLNFAQNLVEQLSGDNNLIDVRSRAVMQHPFTRVKKIQAEAEARYMDKIKELEDGRNK